MWPRQDGEWRWVRHADFGIAAAGFANGRRRRRCRVGTLGDGRRASSGGRGRQQDANLRHLEFDQHRSQYHRLITAYENARDYNKVPADKLPQAKVIPLGKNFQITIAIGQRVITNFAGSQPAQQGGTQTWQVSTLLEDMDSIPAPLVHLICIPGDTRIAACGVTSGNNVRALADAPGTTINVPASDTNKQAELRSAFCDHRRLQARHRGEHDLDLAGR
jgi:hypothetical protein